MFGTWMLWIRRAPDLPNLCPYWCRRTQKPRKYRHLLLHNFHWDPHFIHKCGIIRSLTDNIYNTSKFTCLSPEFLLVQVLFGAASVTIILLFEQRLPLGYLASCSQWKWTFLLIPSDTFKRSVSYLWYLGVPSKASIHTYWRNACSRLGARALGLNPDVVTCQDVSGQVV